MGTFPINLELYYTFLKTCSLPSWLTLLALLLI